MGMIGNTPYQGLIDTGNIVDGAITAAKIKAAADLLAKLGYTPVNKAGDAMTGPLDVPSYARITSAGGAQRLLMGNQDSVGTNKPKIIVAANADLQIGIGDTWSGSGGTFTKQFGIDKDGLVTMPLQPAFLAHSSTNGTVSVANETRITMFDSTKFNIGGCFSSSRFTAPVAGLYHFYAHMDVNKNDGQYTVLNFRVNGSSINGSDAMIAAAFNGGASTNPCVVLLTLKLAASDYVDLYNRNVATSFYSGHCHWGGYLVG